MTGFVQDSTPTRPSTEELAVWRSFLHAHARLMRAMEADLAAAGHLPLVSYDVLVQLAEAPRRRLRMTELAERVLLSRSGLSRLVDRLEREKLVRREPCLDDGRGLFAVATDLGIDRLRSASPVHLAGVSRLFVSRFSPDELSQLGTLLDRVAD